MAYSQYKGRCPGRLMYFLYKYSFQTDSCIFHGPDEDPMITLHGKPLANYTWDGDSDIPTFEFLGDYERWNEMQYLYKHQCIRDEQLMAEIAKKIKEKNEVRL